MSSPDPRGHDRSDRDYGEKPNALRNKALSKKIESKKKRNPLSDNFGGKYDEKEQKRMSKKSKAYRLKHF